MLFAAVLLLQWPGSGQEIPPKLAFVANDKGEYTFDTGVLRGTLRQGGKSLGLRSHPRSHRDQAGSEHGHPELLPGLHDRQTLRPGAWDWPSTAKLLPDGAVQVTSPERRIAPLS